MADVSEPLASKGSWRGLPALIGGLVGGVGVGLLLNVTANAIDPSRVPFILHWGWFGLALYFPLYLIYISPAQNWLASSWHHAYKKWVWLVICAVLICVYAWLANTVITNAWKGLAPQSAIPREPKEQLVPHPTSSPVVPAPGPVTPPIAPDRLTRSFKRTKTLQKNTAGNGGPPQTPASDKETQHQQQPVSPEAQLAGRAVDAVVSCHSFQNSSMKRMRAAQVRIQEHNSRPNEPDQAKSAFAQWALEIVFREDMQLYNQVYKQEFMEVRRLLILKGPDVVKAGIDYENPGNMGGVTGICFDLSDMTEAYINQQYSMGKISLEDGRNYIGRVRQIPR